MSWIHAFLELNKSLFLKGLLLLIAFLLGLQMGQSRLQRRWDAEKQTVQIAQAKQEQHVVDVTQVQNQISKEISDGYLKKSKLLAERQFGYRNIGVCNSPTVGGGGMSTISDCSARVDATSSDPVSVAARDEMSVTCGKLLNDATKSTLMLVEIQRWYAKQLQFDKNM
jgi:hypothetical protein